jgi:crotonobetainyl-CoA:carnitine CoA-transferase CaiB-like acyl-CoA transferase
MAAPLDGIRVLEVANWLAAPAASALMADLGADVIKVEPPAGDIYRGFVLRSMGYDYDFATNYAFQLDNRGKRSITIALDQPGGPELVKRLATDCDIFLTNLVRERRVRYGLAEPDIREVND